jgi:HEAT repeat protein
MMMEHHLLQGDEEKLEGIIAAFSDEFDEDMDYYEIMMHRRAAVKAITSVLGENSTDEGMRLLLAGLIHPSVKIRAGAAHLLGKLGEKQAVAPLLSLLVSTDLRHQIQQAQEQDIRARQILGGSSSPRRGYAHNEILVHAIRALGRLREPRAIEPILMLLHQQGPLPSLSDYSLFHGAQDLPTLQAQHAAEIRASAVLALGMFPGDPRATEALIENLPHEPCLQIRFDTCYALEKLMDPRAIPVLFQELAPSDDPDDEPEEQNALELTIINILRPLPVEERLPYTDLLITALASSSHQRRMSAATILGEVQEVRALPALLPLLEDTQRLVRGLAATALGKLGHQEARAPLYTALQKEEDMTGSWIVTALCRLHDHRMYREVLLALESRHPDTRCWGVESLGYLGDPRAIDALIPLLHDEAWEVCNVLPDALYRIDQERAIQIFLETLTHRETFQDEERRHRARYWSSQTKEKLTLYRPSTSHLIKKIVRLLAQQKDIRVLEPLTALLAEGDEELRPHMMQAIKELQQAHHEQEHSQ